MKLKELSSFLDHAVPLSFQESYDNSGLQTGIPEKEITGALLTLDLTEEVVEEALTTGCDVIISHHPLLFHGIKRLTGSNAIEKILIKAVKEDLAIYSAHTNLDVLDNGVSRKMAEKLGLSNIKVLVPLEEKLLKLVVYIPESHHNIVREAIFKAGAGVIGNYDNCGFSVEGTGTFRGGENTNPYVGEKGKVHAEHEIRFETVLFSHLRNKVINAMIESHPYEEVAYDLYSLQNNNIGAGMGCYGDLSEPMEKDDFLKLLSETFTARGIRYSGTAGKKISRVALCGGSGASLINDAINSGADAFITADIKYHGFFDAADKILMADIGHYESEKFSREILYDLIIKKFPTFAVRFSEINTNPINYL